jgi:hypothetical protein
MVNLKIKSVKVLGMKDLALAHLMIMGTLLMMMTIQVLLALMEADNLEYLLHLLQRNKGKIIIT